MSKTIDREQAFLKNFENDTLDINFNGHKFNKGFLQQVVDVHTNFIKIVSETRTPEEMEPFGYIEKDFLGVANCRLCGKRLAAKVVDEKNINIFSYHIDPPNYKELNRDDSPCETGENITNSFELKFPTGRVAINNVFRHPSEQKYLFDVPKNKEHTEEYSLESVKGRFNKQKYIAEHFNAGYGQMSNMSFEIFISKDRKKLVFAGEPFEDADEANVETEAWNKKFEKEYTKVGDICCDVWHWECADEQVLKKNGYKGDVDVTVKVVPGTYKVTHHFDSIWHDSYPCDKYNIYSEFVLQE